MNLRTRLAVAGGSVVAGALVLVSLVLYPLVEANLRGQLDDSLVLAAGQASAVAGAIKAKLTATGAGADFPAVPLAIGSTQLQSLPAPLKLEPSPKLVNLSAPDDA